MPKYSVLVTALLLPTALAAAERRIEGPAGELVIATGRGTVTIAVGEVFEVRLDGALEDLEAVEVEQDAAAVRLVRRLEIDTVVAGDVVSTVRIGGRETIWEGGGLGPVDVDATVPPGTVLRLEGVTGRTTVGDTGADLFLNCVSCEARLGRIAALQAELTGESRVDVAGIGGRLEVSVTGAGRLAIEGGSVGLAEIAVVGEGRVEFAGHAERASVRMVGAGEVRLGELARPIETDIVGAGRVRVGY